MQPERSKGGDNYQHVLIRLRGSVGRARPEHDVADTREGSHQFRVRLENIYLVRVFTYIYILSRLIPCSSYCCFLSFSFTTSNFDTVFVSLNLFVKFFSPCFL